MLCGMVIPSQLPETPPRLLWLRHRFRIACTSDVVLKGAWHWFRQTRGPWERLCLTKQEVRDQEVEKSRFIVGALFFKDVSGFIRPERLGHYHSVRSIPQRNSTYRLTCPAAVQE